VGSDDIDRRMISRAVSYKRHGVPPEIIAHAVWLHFRFPLSLRLVEEMLLEPGIAVSYETIRRWAIKFGSYAAAKREVMPKVEHRSHKGLNNLAENSHVPIRKRERMMQGFRSWPGLQRFVSTFPPSETTFVPSRSQPAA
jgi:putative transposase